MLQTRMFEEKRRKRRKGKRDKNTLYDYVKPRYGVIVKRRFIKTVFDNAMLRERG